MLSVQASKPTLVQQKKQQWAREREEMSHLYLPWGSGERYTNRVQARNQFASTLELHKQPYEYEEVSHQRSPSLPPIHHIDDKSKDEKKTKEVLNRNIPSAKRFAFYDEDGEGDTSGYGSETVNHRGQGRVHDGARNPVMAWQHDTKEDRNRPNSGGRSEGQWSGRSPRSTTEEGRPRWGDRGVATGRLWEPTAPHERLPQMQNQKKGTPSWVERGLNMIDNTAEVLVIDQRSSTNSGFDCDRSSCNGSDEGRTFLRGQNVPLEPEIKAQRENKRIKALELQSAILSQLEDREKRRQEEREMKLREERLEEIRLQRQQEQDKLRVEEERRRHEEKQLLEQRKLEALKKALEDAERAAKLEKEKRFSSHKQTMNQSFPLETRSKRDTLETKPKIEDNLVETIQISETISPTKTDRTYDVHSAKSQKPDSNSNQTTEFNSPRSTGPGNLNLYIHSVPPLALTDNRFNIVPIGINGNGEIVNGQSNAIQLAVLVPQNLNNNYFNVSMNTVSNSESLETGKVLTPNKYRGPRTKDVATQTDLKMYKSTTDRKTDTEEVERNVDKDYPNIDENAPQERSHNSMKKDRRSDERYKKDLENRPKWGVNRPAAQYKKQSEKDPFYSQKRKMRQKYRSQARQYLSHSSDDSRSPSPPRDKGTEHNTKPRNSLSQSYWRSKRSSLDLSKTNNTSEPDSKILSDYLGHTNDTNDKKSPKMSPTKRITLSQKFINDKYGNRKMWSDDQSDNKNSKCNSLDVENRKKIIDQLNTAKRDYLERNDDLEIISMRPKY
ncbi:histone-lysine N-methyltransferase, H3 lysine-79 specific-like isoform X1 [Leguminivora glycinivorella]|uniref:histone-lysine N-methyltransferase, H3 lysine-79 specific-like isoform X1 n=2 Tax=Leguminivora glycinivorella TaxID=1035111 RepID=UPI00200D667B|nr:histone-lysine N-methyltransferase, H3 lysine-79 specific-like isoform X1 [Leguminivora glycinivorella]